ncbi:MAG: YafY family transcriptional regulator [Thalassovita sp.]
MRRADRLFQIVQYLRGGRLVTAAQLAEKLEVTTRTIYRDVADLIGTGVPIDGEAGVGYILRDGYDLPPLMFTTEEIIALVSGARMIRAWGGTSMAAAAEEALIKINAVLPESARARADEVKVNVLDAQTLPDTVRNRIDQVEQAASDCVLLNITYQDEKGTASTRTIRPLGLWFWGKVWTIVAWCELRQNFRIFRLDRVEDLQEGARFKPVPGQTLRDFYRIENNRP